MGIKAYGKNGTFTWTPSTSNQLSSDLTYAIGIQDPTLQIVYSADMKFIAPIPTPSATPAPEKSGPSNSLVTSLASIASILVVVSIIAIMVWKRKQRKAATEALVIELQEQGHGPQMIQEILNRREQDRQNTKSIKKVERSARRAARAANRV